MLIGLMETVTALKWKFQEEDATADAARNLTAVGLG